MTWAKYIDYSDNGFTYHINTDNETAGIRTYPDTETVIFPKSIVYQGKEYSISYVNDQKYHSAVKDVYLESAIKVNYLRLPSTVCIHVSDDIFSDIVSATQGCYYKVVSDKNRIAYPSSMHAIPNGLESFYDVDNDGKLEVLGMANYYSAEESKTYKFDNCISKAPGEQIKKISGNTTIRTLSYLSNDFGLYAASLDHYKSGTIWRNATNNFVYSGNLYNIADIDGDGRKDLVFGETKHSTDSTLTYYKQLKDGTFKEATIQYTQDVSQLTSQAISNYTPSSGGSGIGSLADGMFVKSKENKFTNWDEEDSFSKSTRSVNSVRPDSYYYTEFKDYNGDGLLDFIYSGNIYYNLGNGRYFKSLHRGTLYSADFNGDGLLDYIDFGEGNVDLYITQSNGSLSEKKTIYSNSNVRDVFFGDYDKDGDMDILLTIPNTDATYFVFMRNDGTGIFKKKEKYIEDQYYSCECRDYDADGFFEILLSKENFQTFKIAKCNQDLSVTLLEQDFDTSMIADFSHEGITKLLSEGGRTGVIYAPYPNAKQNTRPMKMSTPTATLLSDEGLLKITWEQGKDAQTSSCDLTYELRIGTASGKDDIMYAHATSDGTRKNLCDGEMGHTLKYLLNTNCLAEGTYYIAVQAIDNGYMGSEWSDECVYTHHIATPVISQVASTYCTTDTIALEISNSNKNATYTWNIPNGNIIKKSDNSDAIKVIFNRAGEQTVSVEMDYNGLKYKSKECCFVLSPAKDGYIGEIYKAITPIDLDQDGNAEMFYYAWESHPDRRTGFYNYSATDDSWSKFKMSWNSDLNNAYKFAPCDFNMDGYPDFYIKGVDKGNTFINMGDNDGDYDYSTVTYKDGLGLLSSNEGIAIDINNDGDVEFIDKDESYLRYRDIHTPDYWFSLYAKAFYDFNRDGSVDFLEYDNLYRQNVVFLKDKTRNISSSKVVDYELTHSEGFEKGKVFFNDGEHEIIAVADLNNDGYPEGCYVDKDKNLCIVKGKPISEWPCTEIVCKIPNIGSYPTIFFLDLDNNGYLDFLVKDGGSMDWQTVYLMGKDFKYNEVSMSYIAYSENTPNEYKWIPLTPNAYPLGLKSTIKNEAPKVPSNVVAQQTKDGLHIKWTDAEDDHTPALQMRYNISVKYKNKKAGEENAFLISPMNGLNDKSAICGNVHYRRATEITIPTAALKGGETYEIQIQSIDMMGEHSAMSKPIEYTVNSEGYVSINSNHAICNKQYVVSFQGTQGKTYTLEAGDDANIENSNTTGTFNVSWTKSGSKNIKMTVDGKVYTTIFFVNEPEDLGMSFPKTIVKNIPISVAVPSCFLSNTAKEQGFAKNEAYDVEYEKGDKVATFRFKQNGNVTVTPFINNDGEIEKYNIFLAINSEDIPQPTINNVVAEGKNYLINWSTNVPSVVTKVEVSRETNRLNLYEVLDTVAVTSGKYFDKFTDNRVQAKRYRIRYIASNELQASNYSTPHNPLHVMINQCGKGYNLMWNAYEGINVESYTILRGTSEDNLQPIQYVAGSQQSYTDLTANTGKYYYAVAFNPVSNSTYARSKAARSNYDNRSNIISTEEALPTTLASSITINSVESNNSLSNTQQTLHLYSIVLPTYSTYSRVSWSIVNNSDLASISNNGVLTAKGGQGIVTVRATTLDGSNLYADYDVLCNVDKNTTGIVVIEKDYLRQDDSTPIIYYDLEGRKIQTPVKGHLYITNKGKKIVF